MEKIPWIVSTAVAITGKKNSHDIIIVADKIILAIIIVISIAFLGVLFYYIFRQKGLRHRDHHYSQLNVSHTEMNT